MCRPDSSRRVLEPLLQLSPLLRLLALLAGVPGREMLVSAWPTLLLAEGREGDVVWVRASNVVVVPVGASGVVAFLTSTSSIGRSSSCTGEHRSSKARRRRSAMASGEFLALLLPLDGVGTTVPDELSALGVSASGVSKLVSVPWSTRK